MYNFYNHRRAQCVYIKERGVEDGEIVLGERMGAESNSLRVGSVPDNSVSI